MEIVDPLVISVVAAQVRVVGRFQDPVAELPLKAGADEVQHGRSPDRRRVHPVRDALVVQEGGIGEGRRPELSGGKSIVPLVVRGKRIRPGRRVAAGFVPGSIHGSHVRVLDRHVLDARSSPEDQLVVDLPRQAGPRPEVAPSRRAHSGLAVRAWRRSIEFDCASVPGDSRILQRFVKPRELPTRLPERHLEIPAQTQVQGQVRKNLPVVLHEEGVVRLAFLEGQACGRADEVRESQEEVREMESAATVGVFRLATQIAFRNAEQICSRGPDRQAASEAALVMPVDPPELALIAELDGMQALVPHRAVRPVRNQLRLPVRR